MRRALAGLAAALALLAAPLEGAPAGTDGPLEVRASPVALRQDDPGADRIGPLVYRGGLHLVSNDPRFGGYSALILEGDGSEALLLSDRGHLLRLALRHEGGRLLGVGEASLKGLRGEEGRVLTGGGADAEAMARLPGGDLLVAFERHDRLLAYPGGDVGAAPVALGLPPDLLPLEPNKGLEAIALLGGARALLLSERSLDEEGLVKGALLGLADGAPAGEVRLVRRGDFDVTDALALPGGDVLVLERRYSSLGGPGAALRRIPAAAILPGARLEGTRIAELGAGDAVDNMEGLAFRQAADGTQLLYLLSDDNFSSLQRTLLLLFALEP